MKETELQKQCKEVLERMGFKVFRLPAGSVFVGKRHLTLCPIGTPDLMALWQDGKTLFVEIKTEKGKVSTEQNTMHGELNNRGFTVIVVRHVADLVAQAYAWREGILVKPAD